MKNQQFSASIKKVIIVGGGTAGWLAASHLAKKNSLSATQPIEIILVESPDISTIGVGEGTVPAIRDSLKYLGISETDLFTKCDATFKQSIKFVNWENPPSEQGSNYYHHLFDYPYVHEFDPTLAWQHGANGSTSYADSISLQSHLCDAGLAPKLITHKEYEGFTNYAYHLNATKFSQLLADHATNNLGVKRLIANVVDVTLDESGNISHLNTDVLGDLCADFFVDCSGFSSILLGDKLAVPFIDKSDILFTDHAVVAQVPYSEPNQKIASHTISTAQSAGWIWDIGLTERRGLGYVYSSKHTSHSDAENTLLKYIGEQQDNSDISLRKIPMNIGYREKMWEKNCVAIGLSQGFVEPLEATGLLMFDITSRMLADLLPMNKETIPLAATRFNKTVTFAWERVIDFIKLHYCTSKRKDTAFWQDNTNSLYIPNSLQEQLKYWQNQNPSIYDFTHTNSIFNLENYLYVLHGMNYLTGKDDIKLNENYLQRSNEHFHQIKMQSQKIVSKTLPNRALIDSIKQFGLQKI